MFLIRNPRDGLWNQLNYVNRIDNTRHNDVPFTTRFLFRKLLYFADKDNYIAVYERVRPNFLILFMLLHCFI